MTDDLSSDQAKSFADTSESPYSSSTPDSSALRCPLTPPSVLYDVDTPDIQAPVLDLSGPEMQDAFRLLGHQMKRRKEMYSDTNAEEWPSGATPPHI